MPTRVITPVSEEPITLSDAKSHLRVDFADDDGYIRGLISVARDYAEGFQKRSLAPQTLELTLDCFPQTLRLIRGPVKAVTSVKYTQPDGTSVTIPPAEYQLTTSEELMPVNSWPSATLLKADGVQVRYEAGQEPIKPATKQAMLLLIGHWYENRETVIVGKAASEVPMAAMNLLWMDRTW